MTTPDNYIIRQLLRLLPISDPPGSRPRPAELLQVGNCVITCSGALYCWIPNPATAILFFGGRLFIWENSRWLLRPLTYGSPPASVHSDEQLGVINLRQSSKLSYWRAVSDWRRKQICLVDIVVSPTPEGENNRSWQTATVPRVASSSYLQAGWPCHATSESLAGRRTPNRRFTIAERHVHGDIAPDI